MNQETYQKETHETLACIIAAIGEDMCNHVVPARTLEFIKQTIVIWEKDVQAVYLTADVNLPMERHPIADAIPVVTEQLDELRTSMMNYGYLEDRPIVLHEGKVLDGWARYLVAVELGLTPTFETYEGDTPADEVMGRNMVGTRESVPIHLARIGDRFKLAPNMDTVMVRDAEHSEDGYVRIETTQGQTIEVARETPVYPTLSDLPEVSYEVSVYDAQLDAAVEATVMAQNYEEACRKAVARLFPASYETGELDWRGETPETPNGWLDVWTGPDFETWRATAQAKLAPS